MWGVIEDTSCPPLASYMHFWVDAPAYTLHMLNQKFLTLFIILRSVQNMFVCMGVDAMVGSV